MTMTRAGSASSEQAVSMCSRAARRSLSHLAVVESFSHLESLVSDSHSETMR